jgi:pilus assembly protein Flp/PilA
MPRVRNFVSDESGVTAIEYALIASLIAVFIIVAVQLVGTNVSNVFTEVGNTLK